MDISCDIIRDLLPLYAEDLVSDATRQMVDDHLCSCDPCTKQLGILKKAAQLPVEVDTATLKHLGKTIHRRKILTVAAAVLTVITILIASVGWLNVTIYLDPEDAVLGVKVQEDGSLQYGVYDYVMGHSSFGWFQEGYEQECFAHTWNTTRLDYLTAKLKDWTGEPRMPQYYEDRNNKRAIGEWDDPRQVPESAMEIIRMEDCHHWYLDAYSGSITGKLWGEEGGAEPQLLMSLSNHLQKVFWGAFGLTILFALGSRIPWKPWFCELMQRFTIVSASVFVSQLFLTGGKFVCVYVSDEPFRTLRWIFTLSVFVSLTALFWRQLHLLNKKDQCGEL